MIVRIVPGLLAVLLSSACSGSRLKATPAPAPVTVAQASASAEPEEPPPSTQGIDLVGQLDTTFGKSGAAVLSRGPNEHRFQALAVLEGGSIAAVGHAPFGGELDIAVARLSPAGELDRTFGEAGFVRVGRRRGFGHAIGVDRQGRVLAAGYVYSGRGDTDFAIGRIDAKGRLDPSFGKDGVLVLDVGSSDQPHALFPRPNGGMLLVGYHSGPLNGAVALGPDGSLDRSYGNDGVALFGPPTSTRSYATSAALGADGSIAAGGYVTQKETGFVTRVDAQGRALPGFGEQGVVVVNPFPISTAWAVALDSRGRVYLGAHAARGPAVVVRLSRDGKPDRRWGKDGVAVFDTNGDDQFYALLIDGKERVIGVGFRDLAEDARALVARFTPSGELDRSFGDHGSWVGSFGPGGSFLFDAEFDREGRVVACGDVWHGSASSALVVRIR